MNLLSNKRVIVSPAVLKILADSTFFKICLAGFYSQFWEQYLPLSKYKSWKQLEEAFDVIEMRSNFFWESFSPNGTFLETNILIGELCIFLAWFTVYWNSLLRTV